MLDLVRLPGIEIALPAQLSGGQAQRVALARALIGQPQVLLLDEPLAALDLKLRKAMQLELRRIQEELGTSFLYVTHDQEEALTMSDRIVLMNEGRIVQEGSPAEIYDRPATVFASGFIGEANLLRGMVAVQRRRDRPGAGARHATWRCVAPARGIAPGHRRGRHLGAAGAVAGRAAGVGERGRQPGARDPAAPHLPRQHRPPVRRPGPGSRHRRPDRCRRRAAARRAIRSRSPGGPRTPSCCRRRSGDRRRRAHGRVRDRTATLASRIRGRRDSGRPRAWLLADSCRRRSSCSSFWSGRSSSSSSTRSGPSRASTWRRPGRSTTTAMP